jgi:hypothetical protein
MHHFILATLNPETNVAPRCDMESNAARGWMMDDEGHRGGQLGVDISGWKPRSGFNCDF